MEKLLLITEALEYIEEHLTENIRTDDIANELFCSKSSVEKLFRTVTGMSIKDYTIRRRMSRAARDMKANSGVSILDLAINYGYTSNEAFSRAFRGVWHVNPSDYRNNPVQFELFPALRLETELMEDETMAGKKKVDISELYDYIKARENCYAVGVDIKSLIPINDISTEAGDLAIITALKRLEAAACDDDIVFRIGGDEFVLISSSKESTYAQKIVNEVLSHNGECFSYDGKDIPLTLYATSYKLEFNTLRYAELFAAMQNKLDVAKMNEDNK